MARVLLRKWKIIDVINYYNLQLKKWSVFIEYSIYKKTANLVMYFCALILTYWPIDLFFNVWSFIKSFHYYIKQLLKKRLSKTSSSSVTKQEQCAHYLNFEFWISNFDMTTFNTINTFTGTKHKTSIKSKERFNGNGKTTQNCYEFSK